VKEPDFYVRVAISASRTLTNIDSNENTLYLLGTRYNAGSDWQGGEEAAAASRNRAKTSKTEGSMRFTITCFSMLAAFSLTFDTAGASVNLAQWFFSATAAESSGTAIGTIKPDYLGGSSMHAMHCGAGGVSLGGVWQLVKYDRTHHIGLAAASTDQCSVAVFEASPPNVNVPDADLSSYGTGRGIHVGSSYKEVIAAYGGAPSKHGSHVVLRYASSIPSKTMANKPVNDDEILTIVINNDRVTAVTASIDLSGEF
jgi:hypothetical protein